MENALPQAVQLSVLESAAHLGMVVGILAACTGHTHTHARGRTKVVRAVALTQRSTIANTQQQAHLRRLQAPRTPVGMGDSQQRCHWCVSALARALGQTNRTRHLALYTPRANTQKNRCARSGQAVHIATRHRDSQPAPTIHTDHSGESHDSARYPTSV